MPKKKKEPSVEEQRLAYKTEEQLKQEALERKRQQELIAAKQKPKSETAKKRENFWYHYRGITIGVVIGAFMVGFFVKDVIFKTEPDVSIVMVTRQHVPAEMVEALTAELEKYVTDINDDGKIYVSIDSIPYYPMTQEELEALQQEAAADPENMEEAFHTTADTANDYNYTMKLMTVVAASTDPIYLLDEANYEYLRSMGEDDEDDSEEYKMFLPLDLIPGGEADALPLSETVLDTDAISPWFKENLAFYFRSIRVTDKNAYYNESCYDFLESVAIGNQAEQ